MTLVAVALVSVPQAVPEQPRPDSAHVTPLFAESLLTVAVKFCVKPAVTFASEGEIITAMPATMVTTDEADFVGSATAVAVRVTAAGEGTAAGAV